MIRPATARDLPAVAQIYEDIHTEEEAGRAVIGWIRGIYPTRQTAEDALRRGDLFVQEKDGQIVGAGIINQAQVDIYQDGNWRYAANDDEVMVLHTLVISPSAAGRGCATRFVAFYEETARARNYRVLRIDTNARNVAARRLYHKLGFREADILPCVFNGLENVQLVLLEKRVEGGGKEE